MVRENRCTRCFHAGLTVNRRRAGESWCAEQVHGAPSPDGTPSLAWWKGYGGGYVTVVAGV